MFHRVLGKQSSYTRWYGRGRICGPSGLSNNVTEVGIELGVTGSRLDKGATLVATSPEEETGQTRGARPSEAIARKRPRPSSFGPNRLRKNPFGLSFRGVRHSHWRTTRNLALR